MPKPPSIKEWMKGKNRNISGKDLLTDDYCVAGYEADCVILLGSTKYPRFLILSWEKEYLQTKRLLNATSHFLISHIVGHLLEFIKISLGPPILKIDNFT